MAELPLYEEVSAGGREFLLVHAGLEPFQPGKPLEDYGPTELLFHRADYSRPYFSDRLTISGHTPTFLPTGSGADTSSAGITTSPSTAAACTATGWGSTAWRQGRSSMWSQKRIAESAIQRFTAHRAYLCADLERIRTLCEEHYV